MYDGTSSKEIQEKSEFRQVNELYILIRSKRRKKLAFP